MEGRRRQTQWYALKEIHTAGGREEEVATVYVGEGGGRIAMAINTVCLCLCLRSI